MARRVIKQLGLAKETKEAFTTDPAQASTGTAAGPSSGKSSPAEAPGAAAAAAHAVGLPRIGKALAEERAFVFDQATQSVQPQDQDSGQLVADQLPRWKLTKGQVRQASGLNNARRTTQWWLASIQPHLQHLAAASSAGTSLEADLKHITVTLATWDALEKKMAELSMERHGRAKQLVVLFGAAGIGTRGGWGADVVLRACCKVVCWPRGTEQGIMWYPVVAPRKPPQAPCSSQEATQPAASELGPSTPSPAKHSKRTKAEQAAELTQPTKGKGKAAKAKPAPQPGRWVDRDCNAALNMQRIGESRWRPLELCWWPDQAALPAKGKEYPGLGYKRLQDHPPKAQHQPVAAW
ncbi:hypothetical protein QJQ45_003376 [Haematococcus lacustris]|nr:hypothetical protein QJQ45_003376 [Haematococcus lacustris]